MSTPTTEELLNQAASQIDPMLGDCPRCGQSQLRAEFKPEWRPMAEVCALYEATPVEVIASGAKVDAFGRVSTAVPYITCMGCGGHWDATDYPGETEWRPADHQDRSER